jgi:hypothetical protein
MIVGMPADPEIYVSVTEYAVLGLLRDGPRHGFVLAKEFAPGQSLGPIWSVRAPLVYRSLKTLQDKAWSSPSRPKARRSAPHARCCGRPRRARGCRGPGWIPR